MSTSTVDYDALAQQYGGSASGSAQNIDYDALAKQYGAISSQRPGEDTNDVSNKIIVPKPNESFADTMARVRAYGQTVTQDQIDKEMATAPGKVATVLGAAPIIGAAGAAGIAASDMGLYQAAKGLGYASEGVKDAIASPVGKFILKEAVRAGMSGAGWGLLYGVMKKAGAFSK